MRDVARVGAGTPLAKELTGHIDPWLLAGVLFLRSARSPAAYVIAPRRRTPTEASLHASDLPWLAAASFVGGGVGPVRPMVGLARTDGASAGLLLSPEGLATRAIPS